MDKAVVIGRRHSLPCYNSLSKLEKTTIRADYRITGPVGDGSAGDLFEGVGVAAVEPAAVGVFDRLESLSFL